MSSLLQDLRYALRVLSKAPGFAAIAVLTLALGIGANTAVFTVVNAVLLRPLPLPNADRVVQLWEQMPRGQGTLSFPDFQDWRAQNTVFEGISVLKTRSFNLSMNGTPERVRAATVSANYFDVMGAHAVAGRTFLPGEDEPGREREVILSNGLWRRLGADPSLAGKQLALDGQDYLVAGIMPPDFPFPTPTTEIWVPYVPDPVFKNARDYHDCFAVGRLKPGVSLDAAHAQMNTLTARLEKLYPDSNKDRRAKILLLHEQMTAGVRQDLLVLLGAVAFVFLIACFNVTNLMLARAAGRHREIAIRRALGAGRLRLLRHFLTESLLLGGAGAAAGLFMAVWGVDLLASAQSTPLPGFAHLTPDSRVLEFTLALGLLTALGLGLVTALKSSRLNVQETLKEGGRGSTAGRGRQKASKALVIAEVATTLVLLTGAGLMLETFSHLRRVDTGVGGADHILTMKIALPESRYPSAGEEASFLAQLTEKLEAQPSVEASGAITFLPIQEYGINGDFQIEGGASSGTKSDPLANTAEFRAVQGDFFRAMGIPILQGRAISLTDTLDSEHVAVINQALAARYFPNGDALGKHMKVGGDKSPWYTIVGVVGNVHQAGPASGVLPEFDVPVAQWPATWPSEMTRSLSIVVRSSGDAAALPNTVRQGILSVDPGQAVYLVKTMEQVVEQSTAGKQFDAFFLTAFGVLALTLAVIGVYGVLSYGVRQRTHELGVRMTLGAQPRDVLRLVIGEGLALTAIGVVLGIAASLYMTRFVSALLYGVQATDVTTYAGVALLLTAAVLLACYLPARRAMNVDPLVALRHE